VEENKAAGRGPADAAGEARLGAQVQGPPRGRRLTRDFLFAVEQGGALAPFGEAKTRRCSTAIALFETGKRREAEALAERSLPRLKRTPYVDYYAKDRTALPVDRRVLVRGSSRPHGCTNPYGRIDLEPPGRAGVVVALPAESARRSS
jgi:hypothetical protein